MLAHFVACLWIFFGKLDIYFDSAEKVTWLAREETQFTESPWHYRYFFSLYWVLQTITTVGYGDLPLDS